MRDLVKKEGKMRHPDGVVRDDSQVGKFRNGTTQPWSQNAETIEAKGVNHTECGNHQVMEDALRSIFNRDYRISPFGVQVR